jgi:hypothetical protein
MQLLFNHARGKTILVALLLTACALAVSSSALGAQQTVTNQTRASSAGSFLRDVIHMKTKQQFGRMYSSLHPAQQAVVDRDLYIDCEYQKAEALGMSLKLTGWKTVKTSPQKMRIPATDVIAEVTKVTYTWSVNGLSLGTDTSTAVRVAGRWKWILGSKDAVAYKVGRCRH